MGSFIRRTPGRARRAGGEDTRSASDWQERHSPRPAPIARPRRGCGGPIALVSLGAGRYQPYFPVGSPGPAGPFRASPPCHPNREASDPTQLGGLAALCVLALGLPHAPAEGPIIPPDLPFPSSFNYSPTPPPDRPAARPGDARRRRRRPPPRAARATLSHPAGLSERRPPGSTTPPLPTPRRNPKPTPSRTSSACPSATTTRTSTSAPGATPAAWATRASTRNSSSSTLPRPP